MSPLQLSSGFASCGPRQLALVRIALGLYLACQFASWLPHVALLADAPALVRMPAGPFWNALDLAPDLGGLRVALIGASLVALLYAAGVWRRGLAVLLWYAWACVLERTFFLRIPSDGYVGWLLLATVLVPAGESLRSGSAPICRVPSALAAAAWLVLGVSYSASGVGKLLSPSWQSGEALAIVLSSPVANPWAAALVEGLPPGLLALATWAILGLECGYALLCALPPLRRWAWMGAVAMHASVLVLLQIPSVSIGMLIFHAFVFDARWLADLHAPQILSPTPRSRIGHIRAGPSLPPRDRDASQCDVRALPPGETEEKSPCRPSSNSPATQSGNSLRRAWSSRATACPSWPRSR